jgi:hypothetical protein
LFEELQGRREIRVRGNRVLYLSGLALQMSKGERYKHEIRRASYEFASFQASSDSLNTVPYESTRTVESRMRLNWLNPGMSSRTAASVILDVRRYTSTSKYQTSASWCNQGRLVGLGGMDA